MGYTTTFTGSFKFDRPLSKDLVALLEGLERTRRYRRDVGKLAEQLGLSKYECQRRYGDDAEFYFDPNDFANFGQTKNGCELDYNSPPGRGPLQQPSLWLQWRYRLEHAAIEWNGAEKFYEFDEWLNYIIMLVNLKAAIDGKPYVLNGTVFFQGEDPEDAGLLEVQNNNVRVVELSVLPPPSR